MAVAIGITISVLTGVASAVVFWWLQFRVFRPRLQVSSTIARYTTPSGLRHQVKVRNDGRRDITDLTVVVRVVLDGLVRQGSSEVVTLGEWRRPLLRTRGEVQYGLRPEHIPESELRRFSSHLPPAMVAAARASEPIDLLEFLALGDSGVVEVYVFGTDSLSGARGYASAEVAPDKVVTGRFIVGSFSHDTETALK
jgi:hypothetical protein